MLFGRHLGFRGNFEKALAERDAARAGTVQQAWRKSKREAAQFMKVSAVWQFFEAERRGNSIALFAPGGAAPIHTFHFQRQRVGDKLCLSDYILPARNGATRSSGAIRGLPPAPASAKEPESAKAAGHYLFSHGLQALALETAEACAEWLHRRIREDWGFPDSPAMTMAERFTSRYRGKRYSFGYPACPNLEDQAGIWTAASSGRNRRSLHRRNDDGPGSKRQRARVSSSRLHVFFGRRITSVKRRKRIHCENAFG